MNKKITGVTPATSPIPERVILDAEPEPLEIDRRRTGVVIIDMQNAFLSKGAYFDLKGFDIEPSRAAIEPIKRISSAARAKGCKVIYVAVVHYPTDDGGGPDSVYWHKEGSLAFYRQRPELWDKLLLPGTWGAQIVKELEPQKGDIVVEKPRYSGFFDTNLDTVLKRYNIRYMITVGVATNCCVEATVRDAYYRGYFPIAVSDATAAMGPTVMQEAALFNIKTLFGWATTTSNVIKALA